MGSAVSTTVGVVAGTVITVAGLYWIYKRFFDSDGGSGFGFGIGGSGKGDKLFQKGAAGVADEPGGTGGDAKQAGSGDADGSGKPGAASQGGGGTKPTDKPGSAAGSGGQGGSKPDGTGHGGAGGSGGGLGGGSGGGIGSGSGEGSGSSGDFGEGGEGVDDGGGDEAEADPYAGWGDIVITEDLEPPTLTKDKFDDMADLAYELVGDVVWETDLPPPLHEFNPELGSILKFWADVVLRSTYDLPPGKLDPENPTHVPWINLWVDIFLFIVKIEEEREHQGGSQAPGEAAVHADSYGMGRLSAELPRLQQALVRRRGPARLAALLRGGS